jgi:hypothetical protein
LSVAFDVAFDLARSCAARWPADRKFKTKVKGDGQECPSYTNLRNK